MSWAARPAARTDLAAATAIFTMPVDDHSRLAYGEILADEKQETAAAFWTRAQDYFTQAGIIVHRVLTDNGSATARAHGTKL
jgi:hypothetical protein